MVFSCLKSSTINSLADKNSITCGSNSPGQSNTGAKCNPQAVWLEAVLGQQNMWEMLHNEQFHVRPWVDCTKSQDTTTLQALFHHPICTFADSRAGSAPMTTTGWGVYTGWGCLHRRGTWLERRSYSTQVTSKPSKFSRTQCTNTTACCYPSIPHTIQCGPVLSSYHDQDWTFLDSVTWWHCQQRHGSDGLSICKTCQALSIWPWVHKNIFKKAQSCNQQDQFVCNTLLLHLAQILKEWKYGKILQR